MACLELARDIFIVADQLLLPHIDLFYRLPQGSEIARHRLELLSQVGRQGDGSRRCLCQRCWVRGGYHRCMSGAAPQTDAVKREPTKTT